MATVRVILYRPVISQMRGWEGDIGKAVYRLAGLIRDAQRIQAPKKTGKLAASIKRGAKSRRAQGISITVGANPGQGGGRIGYAYWTSEGARPHIITPRPSNRSGLMRFFWPKVGHVVQFRIVHHPGIRNPTHWVEHGADAGMGAWR
jgi:hypothetical protein